MKAITLLLPLLLVSCSVLRPVSKPYFNDDCGEGRIGYCVNGRDDRRWYAAVAAAHDMQLQAASKAQVEKDFGGMHLTLNNADGTESFVYFYFEHPKNTATDTHALRFDFSAAGRVTRAEVVLMTDPSLVEPS
ncbi:MAG: hypothetical protein IKW48_09620 [Akkermansia sp.]|nr:hypothetical protein [Akkermansia sp.]